MPAIAALVVNDGQASPVAHTFNPVGIDSAGIAKYADRSGGIALGFPTITVSMRPPTKASDTYKFTLKIAVPTLDVTAPSTGTGIQPAPSKAYDCLAVLEMPLPGRSSLAERKNLLAYVKNTLALSLVTALVENLEAVY